MKSKLAILALANIAATAHNQTSMPAYNFTTANATTTLPAEDGMTTYGIFLIIMASVMAVGCIGLQIANAKLGMFSSSSEIAESMPYHLFP